MKDDISLVVMAAGNSSRYGSLKQLEVFGERNLTIAEYNLLDAISAGISHFVFVVGEQMADAFHGRLKKFFPAGCTFSLIYQRMEKDVCKYCNRQKPWGTGHAVLSAQAATHGNFGVINADDLYGKNAIATLADFLRQTDSGCTHFCAIGYKISDTLSESGPVSRGVISVNNKWILKEIVEHRGIFRDKNNEIIDGRGVKFFEDTLVSTNLWGFTPKIFDILNAEWNFFVKTLDDPIIDEFYLPFAINNAIARRDCSITIFPTIDKWQGVTYAMDRNKVENFLKN